jgi:hypothetical protein
MLLHNRIWSLRLNLEASDERRERLITTLTEAGGRLRVRNALNPILWLSGVTVPPCLIVLGWAKEPPLVIPIVLCCVVATALFGFLWLLFFDRDRLQSEEYNIRRQTLGRVDNF